MLRMQRWMKWITVSRSVWLRVCSNSPMRDKQEILSDVVVLALHLVLRAEPRNVCRKYGRVFDWRSYQFLGYYYTRS